MPNRNLIPVSNNGPNKNKSNAQPLPPSVRHELETKLGQDLSEVRIHQSHQATLVGAEAFTLGNDIYFAPNKYQPFTESGSSLISHEMSHVVQQRAPKDNDVPKGMVEVDNTQKSD